MRILKTLEIRYYPKVINSPTCCSTGGSLFSLHLITTMRRLKNALIKSKKKAFLVAVEVNLERSVVEMILVDLLTTQRQILIRSFKILDRLHPISSISIKTISHMEPIHFVYVQK